MKPGKGAQQFLSSRLSATLAGASGLDGCVCFIPDEPLLVAEGDAQRIVFPGTRSATPPAGSIFDLFGIDRLS
jgi:hypothetical protein